MVYFEARETVMSHVQCTSSGKLSRLLDAACRGRLDHCRQLIQSGADIDGGDEDGMTSLMMATLKNQIAVVQLLMELSCDLDLTTNHGRSALHLAVWNKRTTITNLLLRRGSDPNIQDQFGDTPLMLATLRGYTKLVKALLNTNKCDIQVCGPEKDTALHQAARHGRPDCVGLLSKHGADLEVKNMWGLTPLLIATMYGNPRAAFELMKSGADYNVMDKSKKTVLHHAVRNNLSSLVVELLRKGVKPDTQDRYGNRPLTEGVQHSDIDIIAFLIRANCDVNAKGNYTVGQTRGRFSPLVMALHKERYKVAELLVQAGCELVGLREELATGILVDRMQNPAMQEWCKQTFNEPADLVVLSRKAWIKYLRSIPFSEVDLVVIPPGLKDYLNYKDIIKSCQPTTVNTVFHYSKMQILVRY